MEFDGPEHFAKILSTSYILIVSWNDIEPCLAILTPLTAPNRETIVL